MRAPEPPTASEKPGELPAFNATHSEHGWTGAPGDHPSRQLALCTQALDRMRQGLCVFDGDQRLLLYNRRYAEIYDLAPEALRVGMTLSEVIDLRYAAGTGPQMSPVEYAAWRGDIAVADSIVTTVVELSNGNVHEIYHEPTPGGGWVATFEDITARRRAEDALRMGGERLRLALSAGRMMCWELDPATDLITQSENSWDVLGLGSGPFSEYLERVHPADRAAVAAAARGGISGVMSSGEFRYNHPRGDMVWLEVRAIGLEQDGGQRVIGVTFDVTARKWAEKKVWLAANRDSLTGLPNRASFQAELKSRLSQAESSGGELALLLLDLDNFKEVNDTLGHDAGDALLQEVATRLRATLMAKGRVARLGGDEFAVVLSEPNTLADAQRLAEQVLRDLGAPCEHRDQTITPRASIGIASYPAHDRDAAELMKDADVALYSAKAMGRNRVEVYSTSMRREIDRKVSALRTFREALCRREVVPYYQPKMRLSTGEILGFEALARWQHPVEGLLTPGRFLAAFDDNELAPELGTQMLRQILADIRTWRDAGLACGPVALNVSAPEFLDPNLACRLLESLVEAGLSPEHLEIEVTETVFLGRRSDQVAATLSHLHRQGIRIALDDFGTGFASLTHLKRFPIDIIKIDQSFVRDLERDPDDAAIVAAVIGLGHSLKMDVVAEGVETTGQARFLEANGCTDVQGFLYAKPMPGSRVPWFLRSRRTELGRHHVRPLAI